MFKLAVWHYSLQYFSIYPWMKIKDKAYDILKGFELQKLKTTTTIRCEY